MLWVEISLPASLALVVSVRGPMNSKLRCIVEMESLNLALFLTGTADNHNKSIWSIFMIIVDKGQNLTRKNALISLKPNIPRDSTY